MKTLKLLNFGLLNNKESSVVALHEGKLYIGQRPSQPSLFSVYRVHYVTADNILNQE